ncbi:MAG: glycosyl transferase family 28 [Deinococcales bacterium]|nr:glycosyl transferase family 28 [Chitinophagaceae bacterium]
MLKAEVKNVTFLLLDGYNIKYSLQKKLFALSILKQLPKIIKVIKFEHWWLQKIIEKYNIDVVISDNRYGLHTTKVPCVFITHQLLIKAPFALLEKYLQKINYHFINKYTQCWVPDFEFLQNIAGVLSHPKKMPSIPVKYIGPLTRFEKKNTLEKKYDYCFVLSGPEPQRSILEAIILNDINTIFGKILLVRGLPNGQEHLLSTDALVIKNHLNSFELGEAMQQSDYIITRSGYTTVMELLWLEKKSIVIPTPGQTEQEYLAEKLMQQGWCYSVSQSQFKLATAINNARQFTYQLPTTAASNLNTCIANLMQNILS